ncbi:hypothetical protein PoMZ_04011, partial [Pyricularia oryzae]
NRLRYKAADPSAIVGLPRIIVYSHHIITTASRCDSGCAVGWEHENAAIIVHKCQQARL